MSVHSRLTRWAPCWVPRAEPHPLPMTALASCFLCSSALTLEPPLPAISFLKPPACSSSTFPTGLQHPQVPWPSHTFGDPKDTALACEAAYGADLSCPRAPPVPLLHPGSINPAHGQTRPHGQALGDQHLWLPVHRSPQPLTLGQWCDQHGTWPSWPSRMSLPNSGQDGRWPQLVETEMGTRTISAWPGATGRL